MSLLLVAFASDAVPPVVSSHFFCGHPSAEVERPLVVDLLHGLFVEDRVIVQVPVATQVSGSTLFDDFQERLELLDDVGCRGHLIAACWRGYDVGHLAPQVLFRDFLQHVFQQIGRDVVGEEDVVDSGRAGSQYDALLGNKLRSTVGRFFLVGRLCSTAGRLIIRNGVVGIRLLVRRSSLGHCGRRCSAATAARLIIARSSLFLFIRVGRCAPNQRRLCFC